MREVELEPVEAWTCPDCDSRNYIEPDGLDDDDTGVDGLPSVVACPCGSVFDVAGWFDDDDDEDDLNRRMGRDEDGDLLPA